MNATAVSLGEAQKNLQKKFKRFYQFGFTGTPIFPQNALGAETTASVFGRELHSYVIYRRHS